MIVDPSLGVTITDLAALFGIDRKEVRKRIADIKPYRVLGQQELYRVRDVAVKLVKIDDSMADIVSRIMATHHADLPKMLSKEYWYGQNQRLRYLRDIGDLWDTEAVVTLASEVFKTLRLSLMLSSDAVDREAGLTEKQRSLVENIMHQALEEAREKLVVSLSHLRKTTNGKAYLPAEIRSTGRVDAGGDDWNGEPRPGDDDYL